MSVRSKVEVPPGVQCFFGEEARRRRAIVGRVLEVFLGWDYEEIIPPLFDYADVFASRDLGPRTYSFVGRDGSLLALRPDFTSLIAKIAAGRLADRQPPIRLHYAGEVLRYEPPRAGRQSELYQMGLEHLGGDPAAADVEVLAIAAECLEVLGVRGVVLSVGHVGAFAGLLEGVDPAALDPVRERVEAKDPAGTREALGALGIPAARAELVVRLTTLSGDPAILAEAAAAFASCPPAAAAVRDLARVTDALTRAGLGDRLAVDLGEVRGLDYYTGLVFRVYARELGFEVGSGGRYDTLLARFGRSLPAVGFMLGLDRVALLLERQEGAVPAPGQRAEVPDTADLGQALARARGLRAAGRRVRFGNGGDR